jgi:hypothetical protein
MYGAKYDLPTIFNWMDAAYHEREIKPVRGRTPECKPLGKRRNTHVLIRKIDHDTIACRLYQTDVVTYHKDGRIVVRLDGYATQTTIAFIEEVLGERGRIQHNHAWISATPKDSTTKGWYALNVEGENIFRRNQHGDLEFENPKQVTTHRINRAGANNVRKQYKPFKDYVVRVMRLRDEGFSANEFGEVFGWLRPDLPRYPAQLIDTDNVHEFLALAKSEQIDDQYKASLLLARSATKYGMRNDRWKPAVQDMTKCLDDLILFAHRDECFVEDNTESGEVVRDAYAKFFGHGK